MRITLDYMEANTLAERFAGIIYGRVVGQRLELIGYGKHEDLQFQEMQRAIRSVDRNHRREFVRTIRWHFQKMRQDKGQYIRGRDYVAKVLAVRAVEAERQQRAA